MADRTNDEDKDRRWRKLGVIGSFVDAAARLAELLLRH
jgi:hypothetical protein